MYPLKKSQEEKHDRNDHRTMRTNPVGTTPTSRTPPPRPYLSSNDHDHLGSHVVTTMSQGKNLNVWQYPEMTLPDYLPVTLLVVMLQRRTGPSDLENYLVEPILEVVGLYSEHGKNYSTLFLPFFQGNLLPMEISTKPDGFFNRCKLTTYTESQREP